MSSVFENRLRRTIEMAGTDGQAGPVPVMATPSGSGLEIQDGSDTRSFVTAEVVDGVPTGNFSQPSRAAKSR